MDLEQNKSWLSLAQQSYPLISEFLQQLNTATIQDDTGLQIDRWLKKHHCKIDQTQLEQSLLWLQQPHQQLVCFPQFPESLKTINAPPAVLFLAGNPKLLFHPQLAVIGSRKPSPGGCENATLFGRALAASGLTIISGMAIGIDALAHQSALAVDGYTTAVLGCGHYTCYPAAHQILYQQIKEKGLIISEFSPNTPVRPHQFPRRNRIISGLSLGVLVVEAAIKSGSLITCRLAAEQGREVFAIPGDISNPMSRGCHHLIRSGASLVEKPEQVLEELNFSMQADLFSEQCLAQNDGNEYYPLLSKDENKLLSCINRHPTSIDCIVNRSGMKMPLVLSVLFSLELKDMVIGSADGYFRRQPE